MGSGAAAENAVKHAFDAIVMERVRKQIKIKLFWRLKKSQWFQSSKYFCDWVRMNMCFFTHVFLIHPSNLVGQFSAHGWPMGCSGVANWLIPQIWLANPVHMAGQWDTLGWPMSWGEGILGAPLGPCVIGYTFWVVVHPAGTLTRPGVHTRIAELAS